MKAVLRSLVLTVGLLGSAPFARADAAAPVHFTVEAFSAAQHAGKPILVEVTAPWCPACKAQAPILARLRKDPRFDDLVTFTIDYDTEKPLMQTVDARLQSTLICFKGMQETGRSVGETQAEWIEAQLEKTK